MGGISIHWSNGNKPVPKNGSIGMASAYSHLSSTLVARASKIAVMTTPTKIKLLSCHHLDCPNHWRDFDTTAATQKAISEIPTSPTVARVQFLIISRQENSEPSWKNGICCISQRKFRSKEKIAIFNSGKFSKRWGWITFKEFDIRQLIFRQIHRLLASARSYKAGYDRSL